MTPERICIIGLDRPEYTAIQERLDVPVIYHDVLPRIAVRDGQLLVSSTSRAGLVAVSRVIFHGIFEDDFDLVTALALWGGPCLPSGQAMMDCRLKFPCLVRALGHSRFGAPLRGYAAPGTEVSFPGDHVAKWGNWHAGENKERFTDTWRSSEASIIEPFFDGESVRILVVGEKSWQFRLEGPDWRKSMNDPQAAFMDTDPDLLADTRTIGRALGLQIFANDYIVGKNGNRHLLEVNHIPDITRFPEIRDAYCDYAVGWVRGDATG